MRVLGLDFESTGLDVTKERITEMGAVLWDVESKRPLVTVGVFLYDGSYPKMPEEVVKITGITDDILDEFGTSPSANLQWLDGFCERHKVDYIVAHNGNSFDRPILMAELDRNKVEAKFLRALPWVDTKSDIPFLTTPDSTKLKYMAGDHGFLNPFAHRAIFDVLTMLRVMAHYDFNAILEYRARPSIVIRAVVPHPRQDNGKGKDLAKAAGFRWQQTGANYKTYPNCWVKSVKEDQFEAEKAKLPDYPVVVIKD